MTASPRLGFTYLTSGQATPETSVNEIGAYLESGAGHFIFKDRDLATPPGSPTNGDCYLVADSPTGSWTGKSGYIAYYLNTAWVFVTVIEGYTAWINDENVFVGYDGASWNTLASPSGVYLPLTGGTLSGDLVVPAEAYGVGWNGSNEVPTKNDVYDKIETVAASGYAPGGTDVALADGGTGASLSDPNADRIMFWDDSAGAVTWLTVSTGLSISGTNLTASATAPTETIIIACSDETTAITTGTGKATFRMPYAFTVTAVRASVTTAPTGSTILIDINESGTTILSTKLMIDASEKTSTTAATPAVISDASLADDAEMTIDFDQVGSTIAGAGVKVYLIGHQ